MVNSLGDMFAYEMQYTMFLLNRWPHPDQGTWTAVPYDDSPTMTRGRDLDFVEQQDWRDDQWVLVAALQPSTTTATKRHRASGPRPFDDFPHYRSYSGDDGMPDRCRDHPRPPDITAGAGLDILRIRHYWLGVGLALVRHLVRRAGSDAGLARIRARRSTPVADRTNYLSTYADSAAAHASGTYPCGVRVRTGAYVCSISCGPRHPRPPGASRLSVLALGVAKSVSRP